MTQLTLPIYFNLNYDGQHHQVTGQSTHAAAQADLNDLTIYTQHDDSSQRLFIKIFNKVLTEPTTVKLLISHVQLTSGNDTSTGSVYQFQALSGQPVQLRKAGSVTMQQQVEAEATAVLTVLLPVRTATLLVFPFVQLATAGTGGGGAEGGDAVSRAMSRIVAASVNAAVQRLAASLC